MLSQEFTQKMKDKLLEEKAQVQAKIKKYKQPEEALDNPTTEDIAQDATDDILEEKLLDIHEQILIKINKALEKIANGRYGTCEKCSAEISEEDLNKEPWAEHCAKCNV